MTRLSCCVLFCRRTRGDRKGDPLRPGMEWICGPHWRLVDKSIKRLRAANRRRHGKSLLAHKIDGVLWRRAKNQAIQRGVGI